MYGFGEALPGLAERAGRLRRRPNAEARKVRHNCLLFTPLVSASGPLRADMLAFWHSAPLIVLPHGL